MRRAHNRNSTENGTFNGNGTFNESIKDFID